MHQKWYKGHIARFWDDSYKSFPYVRQPLMQYEIDEWVRQGYDYVKSFSGMMYDNRNPMPDWTDTLKGGILNYKNLTFTFYKMETLEIMPNHVDHYNTYVKLFGGKQEDTVRILLMLEDWKPGHYLEIDGTGIVNWVAGDYFVWENDVTHAAANIGTETRYTLQITGQKINNSDAWYKLHWYNIPKLQTKVESQNQPFMYFLKHYLNNHDPFYIYMYNQEITELDDIEHDAETIEELNKRGIQFYLYEPLCSYQDSKKHIPGYLKDNLLFYHEFCGSEDPTDLRAFELDSILNYANKNNLTNITVYTCDYNIEKFYPYYNQLNLKCNDIFVKTCRPVKPEYSGYEFGFNKKFISANWRYTPHRHLIVAYLAKLDSYLSWYYKADMPTVAETIWYNLYVWSRHNIKKKFFVKLLSGFEHINRHGPFNLDLKLSECVLIKANTKLVQLPNNVITENIFEIVDNKNNALELFYKDVFCDVVTESRFAQPTANYSEKTYFPMWYKKPFILVAPPYTLKYLREQGYKTFNEFWDESYDQIENHEERLIKIFDLIDSIQEKSIDELREIYKSMIPILEHNYSLVSKILSRNDIL